MVPLKCPQISFPDLKKRITETKPNQYLNKASTKKIKLKVKNERKKGMKPAIDVKKTLE
jgi:hypothetical protein